MTQQVRLKTIALPPEHGAWGFLLEPILLGLLVTPSWAGLLLGLGVLGAFLARHPLKLAFNDRRRGKRFARTPLAERVALGYGLLAALGTVGAVALAGLGSLLPFILVSPLLAVLLVSVYHNRSRDLLPELAGALALAATAPGIALAAGEGGKLALALWLVLAARSVPSVLYVRARLRLERDQPHSRALVLAANLVGVGGVAGLAVAGTAPWLAVLALCILLARAVWGLSPWRRQVRVQTIGFLEMGYGLLVVLLAALGYAVTRA